MDFIKANPHESFAPKRKSQKGYWFVDGDSFMSAAADVIEQAGIEMMGNIFGVRGYAAITNVFCATCKMPLSRIFSFVWYLCLL